MEKLPAKQIYLLSIIIIGIIALSVYSTYAIFTFEGQTSNIVSLYTPNSLNISEEISEYRQTKIAKNSYITTDIDIYNTYDYEICYSVWYQILDGEFDKSLIKIYQVNNSSSGSIEALKSQRIKLLIINDNDVEVKLKVGIATAKNENTCTLNINENKNLVKDNIEKYQELTTLIKNDTVPVTEEQGYLVYKSKNDDDIILEDEKIYIANEYTYDNEIFTLVNPISIDIININNYQSNDDKNYYTCLDESTCKFLYKINQTEKQNIKNEITGSSEDIYKIIDYDIYKGYSKTTSGVKKIVKNDTENYLYYGDNPHNFIYYNCRDNSDKNSCELWRIIGIYYDKETEEYYTKIIRNESIEMYQYNNIDDNLWNNSSLLKYLNTEYELNNIEYLYESKYFQESIDDFETKIEDIKILNNEINSKVNIMSLTDYLLSSSCNKETINQYTKECLTNNWLNNNDNPYWTYTLKTNTKIVEESQQDEQEDDNLEDIILNNQIVSVSDTININDVKEQLAVRPVVYLKPRMLVVEGTGTIEDPYIIK